MGNVIKFHTKSVKAEAEMKAFLAKGATKAKTAKAPTKQHILAEKIKQAKKHKARLGMPGELARCRAIVGGDALGGMLLYRMVYLYREINPKLKRNGKEYLALSRDDLALSAGLSLSELKNRALPRLKKYASEIVEVQAMGNGKDKKLWFAVDIGAYSEALNDCACELKMLSDGSFSTYA